jgi:hypothetical protein
MDINYPGWVVVYDYQNFCSCVVRHRQLVDAADSRHRISQLFRRERGVELRYARGHTQRAINWIF